MAKANMMTKQPNLRVRDDGGAAAVVVVVVVVGSLVDVTDDAYEDLRCFTILELFL